MTKRYSLLLISFVPVFSYHKQILWITFDSTINYQRDSRWFIEMWKKAYRRTFLSHSFYNSWHFILVQSYFLFLKNEKKRTNSCQFHHFNSLHWMMNLSRLRIFSTPFVIWIFFIFYFFEAKHVCFDHINYGIFMPFFSYSLALPLSSSISSWQENCIMVELLVVFFSSLRVFLPVNKPHHFPCNVKLCKFFTIIARFPFHKMVKFHFFRCCYSFVRLFYPWNIVHTEKALPFFFFFLK